VLHKPPTNYMGDANLRIPGTGAQASRELPCKTQTQISPRERQLFFSLWPIPPSRAFCGRALRRRAAAKSAATFSICRSGGSAVLLFCAKELLAGESEGSAAACFTAKRLCRCGRGAGRCAGRVCGCDRQISEKLFRRLVDAAYAGLQMPLIMWTPSFKMTTRACPVTRLNVPKLTPQSLGVDALNTTVFPEVSPSNSTGA
jgi:hypothetical protein